MVESLQGVLSIQDFYNLLSLCMIVMLLLKIRDLKKQLRAKPYEELEMAEASLVHYVFQCKTLELPLKDTIELVNAYLVNNPRAREVIMLYGTRLPVRSVEEYVRGFYEV